MTAILILVAVPIVMWTVQSAYLIAAGLPVRLRIDARNAPKGLRTAGRMTTQLSLLAVVCIYPLLIGRRPLDYYASLFPVTRVGHRLIAGGISFQFAQGAAASTLCLCLLYLAWIPTDRVQVLLHHSRRKWIRRLVLLVPTALFGAFVEEMLFRGVLMADLECGMRNWECGMRAVSTDIPHSAFRLPISAYTALAVSALIFAGAHYVRSVKRRWTFPGHLVLGILLGLAFLKTGTLWLACGLHAGGIFMIMGVRPFFRYQGPAWLTGASIFPFAGVVGIAGLTILTIFLAQYYGGP